MKKIDLFFPHYRLTIAMTIILTMLGIAAAITIPKEEDPKLLNRNGFIRIVLPGADTEKIEDWIVKPLEAKLLSVSAIKEIETKIRPEISILKIELKSSIKDTDRAWNEVQRELDAQKSKFPASVTDVELERDVMDLESVLISVEAEDLNILSDEAFRLKTYLEGMSGVKKVRLHGDPEIGMEINVSSERLAKSGLTMPRLIDQVRTKNLSLPSGTFSDLSGMTQLKTKNSLNNIQELKEVPIVYSNLKSGVLADIAQITKSPTPVPHSIVRTNGKRSIIVSITSESPIDIIQWGELIKSKIQNYRPLKNETTLSIVAFQPNRSLVRIKELSTSLIQGMLSVIIILGFWMGWRIGLVVAISVPVISLIGFAFYFIGGGVLHQISMAALLLSLGQFIDNVTVVAESTQRMIEDGIDPVEAASSSAKQFRKPMIFATGTAIAAFLPLLASEGAPAEFTSSIPLIAVITLLISYFFSLQTTPVLCGLILKKSKVKPIIKGANWVQKISSKPTLVVAISIVVFILSTVSFFFLPKQFFPGADRNEFSVSLYLPEASSIFQTELFSRDVEKFLLAHPEVTNVTTFIGQSTPHYYYSLMTDERVSNRADFLVSTKSPESNLIITKDLARRFKSLPPKTYIIPKILNQGPPVEAAVELELFSDNYDQLVAGIHELLNNDLPKEASHLRTTAPLPLPSILFDLDETKAAERGFDRNQLALNLAASSQGIDLTYYFENGERFPIRIKQNTKAQKFPNSLSDLVAVSTVYQDAKISEFTDLEKGSTPSIIERKNGKRYIRVFSELSPGLGYDSVGAKVTSFIESGLSGQKIEIIQGGQSGESESANLSILRALPLGVMLLIGCLLYEFKSYRKLLLVLISVGFVGVGAFPGILIGGQTFGFTALLGILALIGIVVNNCILIIEAIEEEKEKGISTTEAIRKAIGLRTRPILLTTIMTLAGLLPLALENSTLWPPMAWAMMSGLVISTFFCLITLPEIYRRIFISLSFFILISHTEASTMSLKQLVIAVENSDSAQSAQSQFDAAESSKEAIFREAWAPKLSGSVERVMNDRDLFVASAFGPAPYGKNSYNLGGIELRQPILSLSTISGKLPAKKAEAEATKFMATMDIETTKFQSIVMALGILEIDEVVKLYEELLLNLKQQRKETQRLLPQGRTDPSDLVKVDVELVQVERNIANLSQKQFTLLNNLKTIIPDVDKIQPVSHEILIKGSKENNGAEKKKFWGISLVEKSIQAKEFGADALSYSYLPQVDLVAKYQNTEQGFLVNQTNWYSISIQLRWNIYDGGINLKKKQAMLARIRSQSHELANFKRQNAHSVLNLETEEEKSQNDILAFQQNSQKLKGVLIKERQFYQNGKVPLSQVLDTERLLIEQQQNYLRSIYQLARSRIEKNFQLGFKFDGEEFY